LKIGISLYENQKLIDENAQLIKDNKNEEIQMLSDTINDLTVKRNDIIYKIQLLSKKKEKIIMINTNNKMSSSSYNIISLKNNNIRNDIKLNNKLLEEEIANKNTINESIKYIRCKINDLL
jgi:hypothetical protein